MTKSTDSTKDILPEDLARRVRSRLISHRLDRKMTLNQAALLSGFSRNGLEKIENGDVQPTLETLVRLTKFYGESLPEFFAAVYDEAGYARTVRAELESKVRTEEHERVFLSLATEFGYLEFMEDLRCLKELGTQKPESLQALRTLLHHLASS